MPAHAGSVRGFADHPGQRAGGEVAGFLAMGATVLIWAGFAVSMRAIGGSALAPADVALLRFGLPALVLLPFLPSRLARFRHVRLRDALLVVAGAGLPFFFAVSAGGRLTSAAHVGALVAGTTPLAVALLSMLLEGRPIGRRRGLAIAVILAGVAVMAAAATGAGGHVAPGGVALLLLGSLLWGAYTIGLRRVGLDPVGCTILLTLPSLLLLVPLMLAGAVESRIGQVPWRAAVPFLLVQGLGVGVVAAITYAMAIRRLGAARCAAIGSLAPALGALLAIPVLGEALQPLVMAGVVLITAGVLLANRAPA